MTKRRADDWAGTTDDLLGSRENAPAPNPTAAKGAAPLSPRVRKSGETATTPGGLLRRTVYVTEDEWRSVLEAAIREDVTAAEIVRRALREFLHE